MSPKVLLILLNVLLIIHLRKLLSEEIKPVVAPVAAATTAPVVAATTAVTTAMEAPSKRSKLAEATNILDTILKNHDPKLRPGIGGKPTVVSVEVYVNSLGPISILDMEYTIDLMFYQTWYDERLRYNNTFESLVLNHDMVHELWIPDTFFKNSRKAVEHEITLPNQMVRIYKDGRVLYTIRMTIDARCSLHMFKFPMDSHSCPLSFSSFSYSMNDMIYKWQDNFSLEMNEKNTWKLLQFDLTAVSNKSEIKTTPAGDFVVMTFFFNVSRRFGYVALHNYVPSFVTTMMSWVSFWIERDSAPARTSLGITSVLTMTTLGTFSRKNFPRVSYITALDFYITVCFVFCFCALLEFAVLNFLTYNSKKAHASPKLRHPPISGARSCALARARARQQEEVFMCEVVTEGSSGEDRVCYSLQYLPSRQAPEVPRGRFSRCLKAFRKYFCMVPECEACTWQKGRLRIHLYRLDNYSRVVFPVAFFFFNVVYWLVCLNM
ncbi:gamma-aminobutyric acid receptor subunit epsilon [Octodon degus]|uniref:Gamma-aminobutyric acid receptor subunit epsilon n=1 Tax=Octodon degus TaxID=10160 RepID=A0A6P3V8C9_OCTDE|nr:gamma-aminobutyric acid receptor subunit epsilon [Octodon degus]